MPAISQWNTYAGGTGAAPGKNGYDFRIDGRQYMISPFSNTRGRHMGYVLRVFPNENHGGYAGITATGEEVGIHAERTFRSPQAAATAATLHMARHGSAPAPKARKRRR